MRLLMIVISVLFTSNAAHSENIPSSQGSLTITKMAHDLKEPWAIGFLPKGGVLVTLRGGELRFYSDRPSQSGESFVHVTGLPAVDARGQGGLLDVVVARDFATSREIFLSYSKPGPDGASTAMAVARLSDDGRQLENLRVIFVMNANSNSTKHYGSRIVEARDGRLFLTVGERGKRALAQDLSVHNGKVIVVKRDGSIPENNPFAKGGGLPEIWSLGHRNPQGAALDLAGNYWLVEHGAKGGDEVNQPLGGRNYGWPVIAYGRHYNGAQIGVGTAQAGLQQPAYYWDPSIAPSGLMIYSGKLWPDWQGDFFVGSLKFDYIARLERHGGKMQEVEKLASDETGRVRDVREAPDGSIWFISVDAGAVYRLTP